MKENEDDAYEQYQELIRRFTATWTLRPDLRITARAYDHHVEIEIGERRDPPADEWSMASPFIWHSAGPRNVSTMRELAKTLLLACDFVDEANPKWVVRRPEIEDDLRSIRKTLG